MLGNEGDQQEKDCRYRAYKHTGNDTDHKVYKEALNAPTTKLDSLNETLSIGTKYKLR